MLAVGKDFLSYQFAGAQKLQQIQLYVVKYCHFAPLVVQAA
jgi:hypothetical protein